MRITVVGGGRIGLPLACSLSRGGAHVTVSDHNPAIARAIDAGTCPYEEPDLPELMAELNRSGRLEGTSDTTSAVAKADVTIVVVPAHLTPDRYIDFTMLEAASTDIGRGLKRGALVIYETTVTVGGTRNKLVPVLERHSGLKAGSDFYVAYSPERVKANLVLARLLTTPKIVGGIDEVSLHKAAAVYRAFLGVPVHEVGGLESAEMTKLLGMLYRDVNIALVNELSAFCEVAGVDFDRVWAATNSDGEANLLIPGIGVGGHCTPVYPYFVTRESRRLGITQIISEAAREINERQPARQLDRVAACWKSLSGEKVHILGLGFRPGVKVDTFSTAYTLRDHLLGKGAVVTIEDPHYSDAELREKGFVTGTAEVARVVVLNTAHEEFSRPNFVAWRKAGVEVVLDGRNLWPQEEAERAGILYFGVGRSSRIDRERLVTQALARPNLQAITGWCNGRGASNGETANN